MIEEMVQQYLSQMTAEQILRSDSYFEGGYWLQLWNFLIGLAIYAVFLFTGLSVKIRNLTRKITKLNFVHITLYYFCFTILTTLILFPWDLYEKFFREHKYDLSNQTFPAWLLDTSKGLLIGLIIGSLFIVLMYWIVKKLKNSWWIWGAGFSSLFLAFTMLIFPVFVAPMFNTYKPMEPGPLRSSILSMARANGVDSKEIYQFDASKQSKRISANVSGLWGTMRISLNDNLLERTTPAEVKAVMGHELGHYVLNHVVEMIVYFGLILLIGFAFVHFGMTVALARWGDSLGITSISDIAGLPLVLALLSVYFFAITPIINTIVRSNETEADIFGLNAAREPDGFAAVSLKLSEYRKMSPGPWEEFLFYDHPSGEVRIRSAMQWKVENTAPSEVTQ